MAADALDGLEVHVGLRQRGNVSVPEDVGRRAEELDVILDVPEHPAEDHLGHGLRAAQHVSGGTMGLEKLRQPTVQRDGSLAAVGLGGADLGLVVGIGDVALDVDQLLLEVDVLPAQAEHFAPAYAREHEQRQHPPFVGVDERGDGLDDGLHLLRRQGVARLLPRGGNRDTLAHGRVEGDEPVLEGRRHDLLEQDQHRMDRAIGEVRLRVQEFLDVVGGDLVQPLVPEEREQVQPERALVAAVGGRPQLLLLVLLIPLIGVLSEGRAVLLRLGIQDDDVGVAVQELPEQAVLDVEPHDVVVQLLDGMSVCPLVDCSAFLIRADAHALLVTFCHIRCSFRLGFQSVLWSRFVVFKERKQRSVLFHQLD